MDEQISHAHQPPDNNHLTTEDINPYHPSDHNCSTINDVNRQLSVESEAPIRTIKEFEAFVFSQSAETQRALGKIIAFILRCAGQ